MNPGITVDGVIATNRKQQAPNRKKAVFAWALSVIPAKDGWWTTPSQPGHPYKDNRTENLGALHGAVATMSRGPVSPADKIGLFNRSQIMRSW